MQETVWHTMKAEDTARFFGVNISLGLAKKEADERLKKYGKNAISRSRQLWFVRLIAAQIASPLVFILLLAGGATALLGEWLDTFVIVAAFFVNVVVGALQEGRASRVFETLATSQEKNATVLRGGEKMVVSAPHVVPGDIIFLEGGGGVPADARLIEANNVSVNEAALTGEWAPVLKSTEPVKEGAPINERTNIVWKGTSIVTGQARGIVIATGLNTEFGKIAKDTAEIDDSATPLQKGVRQVARFLTSAIGVSIVVIVALGLLRGELLVEMVLVAIAVAVASIPSGLPAAVTVVLAIGMEAILKCGGLVRNLLAAETLGSTTYVLTDKTGTLTEGVMSVSGLYTARSIVVHDTTVSHDDNHALLEAAVLASDAFVAHDENGNPTVHGRPIERAIVTAGLDNGISQPDLFVHGSARVDFLPFESTRRFSASLNTHKNGARLYISGSPEHLLELSRKCFVAGAERELDDETREKFMLIQKKESGEGRRFIAVGYVAHPKDGIPTDVKNGDPKHLVFLGFIAFSDAVRADVPEEIRVAKRAGMRVVMVTGDYAETARAVARETGIAEGDDDVITGKEIEEMSDEELLEALRKKEIFARVLPNQKLRIVHVLKSAGEIVSMTGDGVNDAPALVAANIGVAVGSGTDVAKEASDMILLNNTFSTITAAVREGRRAIDNLRKIIAYLLSTSFSEIIVIGGALAAGAPLPLLPGQILWANLVEEGFMSFPFAFEPAEKDVMERRAKNHGSRRVITPQTRSVILIVTAITGVILLALYFVLRHTSMPLDEIRTVMFVALSLDSIFFALSFKDLHRPLWKIPLFNNMWVFLGLLGSVLLLIGAVTLPPLQTLLSLVPLSLNDMLLLVSLGFLNLFTIEVTKHFASR